MIKKKKGYVLLSVMSLSVLLLVLGSSAVYMSQMGSQTISSEMQYQKAKFAAEYGLNQAVKTVNDSTNNSTNCSASVTDALLNGSKAKYSYSMTKAGGTSDGCFVHSVGTLNGTRVVKTVVVPYVVLPATGGAINAGTISSTTFNGINPPIGSDCGPAVVYQSISPGALADINAKVNTNAAGDPKTLQDTTTNVYTSNFVGTTNWDQLKTKVKTTVAAKAAAVSNNLCTVLPTGSAIATTTCNANATSVVCTGGLTKTVLLAACPDVVISAGTVNINADEPSTTKFTVNATNSVTVSGNVQGLIASDGVLDIGSGAGDCKGIFIGSSSTGVNISHGSSIFDGLLFYGNDTHTSSVSITTDGNTKFLGSLVVDGTLANYRRNGGGSQSPNIQYDATKINLASSAYPGFMNTMNCNSGPPPKSASLRKTKMIMY